MSIVTFTAASTGTAFVTAFTLPWLSKTYADYTAQKEYDSLGTFERIGVDSVGVDSEEFYLRYGRPINVALTTALLAMLIGKGVSLTGYTPGLGTGILFGLLAGVTLVLEGPTIAKHFNV